ncbi:hypothetical protein ACFV6E_36975 [Streptomyces sp. NPDC059785]|uniref:hypothetical protein n=1 Tax=unclassified Streptomyces TaxID=2593676 RepID=UPI0036672C6A
MRPHPAPLVAALDEPARDVTGRPEPLWHGAGPDAAPDAATVRLPPGGAVERPVDRELLVVVLEGAAHLHAADGSRELTARTAVWLPAGPHVRLHAGDDGAFCLTVRPARTGVTVPPAGARPVAATGGDPACLLHLVCAECGRMAAESDARYCNRCGAPLSG